ncbi:MAG: hypothetical protein KDC24_05190 [Saprospiraceae bacterium]|nr:hypothetical protein [Saprospiraceae bacterium]
MSENKYFDHPAREIFLEMLQKELTRLLLLASVAFFIGLGLTAYFLTRNIYLASIGLGLVILGTYLFVIWSRIGVPENAPIYKTLKFNPTEIVWVYTLKVEIMPFGIKLFRRDYLTFKFISGKEETIPVHCTKCLVLENWLKRVLPFATFGYSHERLKTFQEDPSKLKKDNLSF